ncbi:MAG: hypothetical protein JJE47_01730 [Acidimicrobiia bacterium]|nr:hypothetical protein [Acidimicrobiia bacterium]
MAKYLLASCGGGANPVTGYSIVETDSIASALGLTTSCPILDDAGTVELCETFNVGRFLRRVSILVR